MQAYQDIDFSYDALTVLTKPEIMGYGSYAEQLVMGFVLRRVCKTFYRAINSHGSSVYPPLAMIPCGAYWVQDGRLYHTTAPWYHFTELVFQVAKVGLWDKRCDIPSFLEDTVSYELVLPLEMPKRMERYKVKSTITWIAFDKKLRHMLLVDGCIAGDREDLFTRLFAIYKESDLLIASQLDRRAEVLGCEYDKPWAYFKTYDPLPTGLRLASMAYKDLLPFPIPLAHWTHSTTYQRELYVYGAVKCLQTLVDRTAESGTQLVTLWKNLGRMARDKSHLYPYLERMMDHFRPQYEAHQKKQTAARNRAKRQEKTGRTLAITQNPRGDWSGWSR
jgi:hypothetical protein